MKTAISHLTLNISEEHQILIRFQILAFINCSLIVINTPVKCTMQAFQMRVLAQIFLKISHKFSFLLEIQLRKAKKSDFRVLLDFSQNSLGILSQFQIQARKGTELHQSKDFCQEFQILVASQIFLRFFSQIISLRIVSDFS